MRTPLTALMLLLIPCAARAQEVLLLTGDAGGGRVVLKAAAGAPAPWSQHPVSWFFVRGDGTQRNLNQVTAAADDASAFAVAPLPRGAAVIGADFAPRVQSFAGAEWSAFLKAHTTSRDQGGAGQVRVRRIESVKTIIRSGAGGDSSAVGKTGQAVEIRSLMDPTVTPPGSDVALRVFSDGGKVAGGRLTAQHVESGRLQELTANGEGIANLPMTAAGLWRVEFHHAAKLAGDAAADWELRTATLTFTAPRGEKP